MWSAHPAAEFMSRRSSLGLGLVLVLAGGWLLIPRPAPAGDPPANIACIRAAAPIKYDEWPVVCRTIGGVRTVVHPEDLR